MGSHDGSDQRLAAIGAMVAHLIKVGHSASSKEEKHTCLSIAVAHLIS